ncbi:MAG: TetR/AcrR family transcriptional regulator [Candidatus Fermentibacteraceae bacterium]|nr:TetR/AcrR family transcriptional regulator [Candidatus Fermentibacteraceae bacterium]
MHNKPYHHGNLREKLINEAMRALCNHGIDSITLRKLSKSLGVSKAAPYRHFENKAALLAAVAAEGFRKMRSSFEKTTNERNPQIALRVIMEHYIAFATGNPELYRLMFSREVINLPVSEELLEAATGAYIGIKEILSSMNSSEKTAVNVNTAWALVHGISLLINNNLLVIDEQGNTVHALSVDGENPADLQISEQISSAIDVFIKGLST